MQDKKIAGIKAAEYIEDNMVIGLGTGSTAFFMIERLGQLVKAGLNIKAVATSNSTAELAVKFSIPLVSINEVKKINLAIDGVDEIDGRFNAIKGGGGALFREKIVANLAEKVIWIMDSSKRVDSLGAFPLPIEVLPFGYSHIIAELKLLSFKPVLRINKEVPFITDNHNYIIDLHMEKAFDVRNVSDKLKSIPGILETGLFVNNCDRIIVGSNNGAEVIENTNKGI